MKFAFAALLLSLAPAQASDRILGFEEIREACRNPARFHNQVAPSNLQISCEERGTKWLPVASSHFPLPRRKEVISSLSSDKYLVPPSIHALGIDDQQASCPIFKEVLETISFAKATSCEELLAFDGSEVDFCVEVLGKVRQTNPKSIRVEETGIVLELCQQDKPWEKPVDRCERGQRHPRDGRCQR